MSVGVHVCAAIATVVGGGGCMELMFLFLAAWCRRSSYQTHAIVLLGPRRAFSNVARA